MYSKITQRQGVLWTPDDPLDFLAVDVEGDAGDEVFEGMLAINQAGRDLLTGKILVDTYCDILEHHDIPNPYAFLDEVTDHILWLTNR